MSNERPEILLKTDTKTITLELGREGKFSAKATGVRREQGHQAGREGRDQRRPRALANR
jgi:hypothetical protein